MHPDDNDIFISSIMAAAASSSSHGIKDPAGYRKRGTFDEMGVSRGVWSRREALTYTERSKL